MDSQTTKETSAPVLTAEGAPYVKAENLEVGYDGEVVVTE